MSDEFWAPKNDINYQSLEQAATKGDKELLLKVLNSKVRLDALFGDEGSNYGMTALHLAVYHGHSLIVRLLLEQGVDVDILSEDQMGGGTPLYFATVTASAGMAEILLDAGASTDIPGPQDESVLSSVLLRPNNNTEAQLRTISLLLDRGMSVDSDDEMFSCTVVSLSPQDESYTLLTHKFDRAVMTNNQKVIHYLIDKGASLEGSLVLAVEHDDVSLLHILIDAGAADTDCKALTRAASKGKMEIVRMLLADKQAMQLAIHNADPVCAAAGNGHIDVLEYLLASGFPLNTTDRYGFTPIQQAVRSVIARPDVVQLLVQKGADLFARSVEVPGTSLGLSLTILHLAAGCGHLRVIEQILNAAPSLIRERSGLQRSGDTPFLTSARSVSKGAVPEDLPTELPARVKALAILLDAGADINECDEHGRTALHILAADCFHDHQRIKERAIRLLIERGANIHAQDRNGHLPPDLANDDAVTALLFKTC